jgi:hypothetical protein
MKGCYLQQAINLLHTLRKEYHIIEEKSQKIEEALCYKLQTSANIFLRKVMHRNYQLQTINHKRPPWKHMPTIFTKHREKMDTLFLRFSYAISCSFSWFHCRKSARAQC